MEGLFLPFDQALRVARQLRLVSPKEWKLWCGRGARPASLPACPGKTYVHDGWAGWEHWLYYACPDKTHVHDGWTGWEHWLYHACPDKLTHVHDGWTGWEHSLYHANLDPAILPAGVHRAPCNQRRSETWCRHVGQVQGQAAAAAPSLASAVKVFCSQSFCTPSGEHCCQQQPPAQKRAAASAAHLAVAVRRQGRQEEPAAAALGLQRFNFETMHLYLLY